MLDLNDLQERYSKAMKKAIFAPGAWNPKLSIKWLSEEMDIPEYIVNALNMASCSKVKAMLRYGMGAKTANEEQRIAEGLYAMGDYFDIAKGLSNQFVPVSGTQVYRYFKKLGVQSRRRGPK